MNNRKQKNILVFLIVSLLCSILKFPEYTLMIKAQYNEDWHIRESENIATVRNFVRNSSLQIKDGKVRMNTFTYDWQPSYEEEYFHGSLSEESIQSLQDYFDLISLVSGIPKKQINYEDSVQAYAFVQAMIKKSGLMGVYNGVSWPNAFGPLESTKYHIYFAIVQSMAGKSILAAPFPNLEREEAELEEWLLSNPILYSPAVKEISVGCSDEYVYFAFSQEKLDYTQDENRYPCSMPAPETPIELIQSSNDTWLVSLDPTIDYEEELLEVHIIFDDRSEYRQIYPVSIEKQNDLGSLNYYTLSAPGLLKAAEDINDAYIEILYPDESGKQEVILYYSIHFYYLDPDTDPDFELLSLNFYNDPVYANDKIRQLLEMNGQKVEKDSEISWPSKSNAYVLSFVGNQFFGKDADTGELLDGTIQMVSPNGEILFENTTDGFSQEAIFDDGYFHLFQIEIVPDPSIDPEDRPAGDYILSVKKEDGEEIFQTVMYMRRILANPNGGLIDEIPDSMVWIGTNQAAYYEHMGIFNGCLSKIKLSWPDDEKLFVYWKRVSDVYDLTWAYEAQWIESYIQVQPQLDETGTILTYNVLNDFPDQLTFDWGIEDVKGNFFSLDLDSLPSMSVNKHYEGDYYALKIHYYTKELIYKENIIKELFVNHLTYNNDPGPQFLLSELMEENKSLEEMLKEKTHDWVLKNTTITYKTGNPEIEFTHPIDENGVIIAKVTYPATNFVMEDTTYIPIKITDNRVEDADPRPKTRIIVRTVDGITRSSLVTSEGEESLSSHYRSHKS